MTADGAEIISIGDIQRPLTGEQRAKYAQALVETLRDWVAGHWDGTSVTLVISGGAAPTVHAEGLSWDSLTEAQHALGDMWSGCRRNIRGQDIHDHIASEWQSRIDFKQAEKERAAAIKAAHPWRCDHCNREFKTERGTLQHERTCWYNPAVREQHAPIKIG